MNVKIGQACEIEGKVYGPNNKKVPGAFRVPGHFICIWHFVALMKDGKALITSFSDEDAKEVEEYIEKNKLKESDIDPFAVAAVSSVVKKQEEEEEEEEEEEKKLKEKEVQDANAKALADSSLSDSSNSDDSSGKAEDDSGEKKDPDDKELQEDKKSPGEESKGFVSKLSDEERAEIQKEVDELQSRIKRLSKAEKVHLLELEEKLKG